MAELKRKDEELTTADLAGKTDKPRTPEARPELVRDDQRKQPESVSAHDFGTGSEAQRSRFPGESSASAGATDSSMAGTKPNPLRPPDAASVTNEPTPLFSQNEIGDFRSRWSGIQTAFVDEPRRAVGDADNLVASLMKKLAEGFANERSRLEGQWDRGDNVSTEDLRLALQRYRSFFDRLLKV